MSVFADQRFIDAFVARGEFPAIHDKVAAILKARAAEPEPFVDLGACIGLLSARALALGRSEGHAIEGTPEYLARAVQLPRLTYHPFYVGPGTLEQLAGLIRGAGATLCIARRVLPEIDQAAPGIIPELAGVLRATGIRKWIVQGRVPVKRPAARLACIDLEVEAIGKAFTTRCQLADVVLLEPR